MPFVPVPATARCIVKFTLNGIPNKGYILHFRKTTATTVSVEDLEILSDALAPWISADLAPAHGGGVTFNGLVLRSLASLDAPAWESDYPSGVVGTRSGATMPGNVCIAVHKTTTNGGRSGAGRVFHTGLTETDVGANTLDIAAANVILNAWNALEAEAVSAGFRPALVSYQTAGVVRETGLSQYIINWSLRDRIVDTQRGRLS